MATVIDLLLVYQFVIDVTIALLSDFYLFFINFLFA